VRSVHRQATATFISVGTLLKMQLKALNPEENFRSARSTVTYHGVSFCRSRDEPQFLRLTTGTRKKLTLVGQLLRVALFDLLGTLTTND
jgi:hypothetical protein